MPKSAIADAPMSNESVFVMLMLRDFGGFELVAALVARTKHRHGLALFLR
jgi:hypothetical protein